MERSQSGPAATVAHFPEELPDDFPRHREQHGARDDDANEQS
jgi:hypothetical protein